MATHSTILVWRIPWTEEPGGLQSTGSQSRTQLSDFTFTFHNVKEHTTHFKELPKGFPSLVAQRLKCLPAMRVTRVRSLGREDPLEKEMATHSSFLAWEIPWTQEPGGLQSTGSQRVGQDWPTSLSLSLWTKKKV